LPGPVPAHSARIIRRLRCRHEKTLGQRVCARGPDPFRADCALAGSFKPNFKPANPNQTLIFWAVSSLIFVLMVTLGWILCREFVKLYVERQSHREGSRIRPSWSSARLPSVSAVFLPGPVQLRGPESNLAAWFREPARKELGFFEEVPRNWVRRCRMRPTPAPCWPPSPKSGNCSRVAPAHPAF